MGTSHGKESIRVWYSNPYSITKNIGGAINAFCNLVPEDDDWIVIQDGDIIYLTPDWGKRIHETLEKYGNDFGLVGCYTNRLRGLHQLHENRISPDHDLKNHYEIAKTYDKIGIVPTSLVAGFFMAFQKKTWKAVGGFEQDSIVFDSKFNAKVRRLGLKIGLMQGLYVYHSYRIWADVPQDDIRHLR